MLFRSIDFMNQSGDLKFDLSIEYRNRLFGIFQLATFIDAGNIWTLRNYDTQPNGQFKFNHFYKEIALAGGMGFRLDFDFFLIRIDTGIKIFDPGQTGSNCWRITKFNINNDLGIHFAIGYPF